MSDPTRVLNPVDVEAAIRDAANVVAQGVDVVTQRLAAYREAQRLYDQTWAHSFLHSEGTVEDRKQRAVIDCRSAKEALDVAEVGFKYAERKARAAESTLSAYQTLSRSVTAMYSAAGKGEY